MELKSRLLGDTLLVYLNGELDLNVADKLRDELDKKLEETKALNLLFDLSGVVFIDSSGLGVILGRYKRVSGSGGKVVLAGARPHVRNVLELSGLLGIMEEFTSSGEALDKIG